MRRPARLRRRPPRARLAPELVSAAAASGPPFVEDPRPAAPEEGDPWPTYAFVFPTYNASAYVGPLLESIFRQDASLDFEVVACDDCSTDDTAALLEADARVKLVRTPVNSGPSVARNTAAVATTADYLIFLDADVVLEDDTLAQIDAFRQAHPEAGAFHWPMSAAVLAPGLVGLYKTLLDRYMTRVGGSGVRAVTFMSARGGLIRRELFFGAGGYDPRYRRADIEDWEFSRRLTPLTTILHTDAFTIHHHQSPSFRANLRNYFRRAFLFTRLTARSKRLDNYTETTPLNSIATLSTLPALALAALAYPLQLALPEVPGLTLGGGQLAGLSGAAFLAAHLLINAPFFGYCVRERGLVGLLLLPCLIALRFVYSLAVACGVATAVALWPLGGWPFEHRA